jgi:hypothetical protein
MAPQEKAGGRPQPPEVAQITETVVPGVPWKYRAIA